PGALVPDRSVVRAPCASVEARGTSGSLELAAGRRTYGRLMPLARGRRHDADAVTTAASVIIRDNRAVRLPRSLGRPIWTDDHRRTVGRVTRVRAPRTAVVPELGARDDHREHLPLDDGLATRHEGLRLEMRCAECFRGRRGGVCRKRKRGRLPVVLERDLR